ncbi:hypothetical protein CDD82_7025 [Ophiocordyceps australis]|uniref:DUF427 domain-containing protein n=1 Tax=Ophiocordyceps australis TaxID=1399860 RepID=A0A2C5YSU7_9HYPO|nr:hypothetical protein CDD82_7025 [Ophiocordyceps australis]
MLKNGPRKVHAASRRVRVIFNHTTIVDTVNAFHVWEHQFYPQFYVPMSELRGCTTRDVRMVKSDSVNRAALVELTVPDRSGIKERKTDRVLRFTDDKSLGALTGLVRLEFGSMDQWLEEDVPVHVHPKDPFKRIDILASCRPIEIKLGSRRIASSPYSMHLIETGLPVRYYLPPAAVDPSMLRKSDQVTKCPYKGEAQYYHVLVDGSVARNLVWQYQVPTPESCQIAGLLCFFNERVDIYLDGKLQQKPDTPYA